jgi:hydroxylation protein CepL
VDLADPDLYAKLDRIELWRRFVADDAIVWSEPGASPSGFWSVFTHATCARVLDAAEPFTSRYGMLLGFDASHPDRAGGRMVVASDGPRHGQLRELLAPLLSRSSAVTLQPFVEAEAGRLLAAAREQDTVDVAGDLAPRLPAAVVCELLGVPASDREKIIDLTNHAFASPISPADESGVAEAHTHIFFYLNDLVDERRHHPADDVVSALLEAPGMGPDDVLVNLYNVLIGGNQTSRHVIAGCFLAAVEAPGLLDLVRDEPSVTRSAVEELLRWVSPGMHVLRVATGDVEINDQRIQRGDAVVAWLAAANRDPRVFDAPDAFEPRRRPNRHLSFGHGPHLCLGAHLARLEAAVLLQMLAAQAIRLRPVGEPIPTRSNLIQGYQRLDVEIEWCDRSPDGP